MPGSRGRRSALALRYRAEVAEFGDEMAVVSLGSALRRWQRSMLLAALLGVPSGEFGAVILRTGPLTVVKGSPVAVIIAALLQAWMITCAVRLVRRAPTPGIARHARRLAAATTLVGVTIVLAHVQRAAGGTAVATWAPFAMLLLLVPWVAMLRLIAPWIGDRALMRRSERAVAAAVWQLPVTFGALAVAIVMANVDRTRDASGLAVLVFVVLGTWLGGRLWFLTRATWETLGSAPARSTATAGVTRA